LRQIARQASETFPTLLGYENKYFINSIYYSLLNLTDDKFCTGVGAESSLPIPQTKQYGIGAGALLSNIVGEQNTGTENVRPFLQHHRWPQHSRWSGRPLKQHSWLQ
jgi:hypothetical protein